MEGDLPCLPKALRVFLIYSLSDSLASASRRRLIAKGWTEWDSNPDGGGPGYSGLYAAVWAAGELELRTHQLICLTALRLATPPAPLRPRPRPPGRLPGVQATAAAAAWDRGLALCGAPGRSSACPCPAFPLRTRAAGLCARSRLFGAAAPHSFLF